MRAVKHTKMAKYVLTSFYILLFQLANVQVSFASDLISLFQLKGDFIQGGLIRGHLPMEGKLLLDGKKVFITHSGDFAFGFGRDAAKQSELVWITADGSRETQQLQIKQRQYRIQKINGLPVDKVTPRTREQKLHIKKDIALTSEARSHQSSYLGFVQKFIWPAAGRISGVYGSQRVLNGQPRRPHFGLDIAGPTGSRVIAPADGQVVVAEPDMYFSGGTVIIDHGGGVFSSFLHLSKINVRLLQMVKQGEAIAEMGASGRVTGPHLDWRINWFNIRLDPAKLVSAKPPAKVQVREKRHDKIPPRKLILPAGGKHD